MKKPVLDLYYFESCPYCQRVLRVIHELNVLVNFKDIYGDINDMQKLMYIT
jgi:glutaredoxin